MHDAVLVTLTRGGHPESEHHGAYCVVEDGRAVYARGNLEVPTFFRSAAKPFQALSVVESGAADRYALTTEELAITLGSHDGSPKHAQTAASILRKCGASPDLLRCGGHIPTSRSVYEDYIRKGYKPGRLEDNCSGKHAGMIAAACAWGEDPRSYVEPTHRVQREILQNVALFTGVEADKVLQGTDGCAAPNFAVPLPAMARAVARFVCADEVPDGKAAAARRLLAAVLECPEMIAGPKRFDTKLIRAGKGAIFSKGGAEGVQIVGVPSRKLAIAIKIADGATRAANAVTCALLLELDLLRPEDLPVDYPIQVKNREGTPVGEVRVDL